MTTLMLVLSGMALIAYSAGRSRALASVGGPSRIFNLHSLPGYYGYYTAMWCLLPALAVILLWLFLEPRVVMALLVAKLPDAQQSLPAGQLSLLLNNIQNLATGDVVSGAVDTALAEAAASYNSFGVQSRRWLSVLVLALALLGGLQAWRRVQPRFRARNRVETMMEGLLIAASSIAILTTLGIVMSVLFEALRFFGEVPASEFLFGTNWSPQTAIREDQVGSSGSFGAVPLFAGTLLITAIAMSVAVPVGLLTAIYLAEYANSRVRNVAKPLLEILAGIPTVVYGFFAALTVAPAIRNFRESLGFEVASESA
ncbi:MAG: phosphate ABC transporter permease family protein, partial [Woeseia sp.]